MTAPTRTYLAFVLLAALAWMAATTFGPERDPYELRGYGRLQSPTVGCTLHGRVILTSGLDGSPAELPTESLVVRVRAIGEVQDIVIEASEYVEPDGDFAVHGLPAGRARVSVRLASGEVVFEAEDIPVTPEPRRLHPRLDPIDLTGRVVPFEVFVVGPSGDAAREGEIAWRPSGSATEDVVTYGGVATISEGRAEFLAASDIVDVIGLVPGAVVDLFEYVQSGDEIRLGLGTELEVHVGGDLPDPRRWSVRAFLHPIELVPEIDFGEAGRSPDPPGVGPLTAVLDRDHETVDAPGVLAIPVVRGGRYALRWFVVPASGSRSGAITLHDDEGEIELPSAAGKVVVERRFPVELFTRGVAR